MADPRPDLLEALKRRLAPYPERFGKPTVEEREALRCTASNDELVECHRLVGEALPEILSVLDDVDWREIPAGWQPIANLVLFQAEIDSPVEKWIPRFGLPHLPDALDPRHFEAKRNFYDMETRETRTLLAERLR